MSSLSAKSAVLIVAPLPSFLAEPLSAAYSCHDYFHAADKTALLGECGTRVQAIVMAGGTVLNEPLMNALPSLKIISVFGVGYDGVPLKYCRDRGICLTNTPDVLTEDVADTALALVLMTARKLAEANRFLHAEKWPQGAFELGTTLGGKRAGIFGLGRIGKAIARRLLGCGMEIGYHGRSNQPSEPYPFFPTLNQLAGWADFLIVSCPGGTETRHVVNAEVLHSLGRQGTLINIARGSIVDEAALIDALQNGVIKTAALDVFEHEPQVPAELMARNNVVLLPHVGSATDETRQAMADLVLRNLSAHFAGKPLVTPVPL
ncbi:2-hydroxyacid dehydrogenase [soil metagenome]